MERIALELRTAEGLSMTRLSEAALERAEPLIEEGLIKKEGTHLILTHSGKALVDRIAEELLP